MYLMSGCDVRPASPWGSCKLTGVFSGTQESGQRMYVLKLMLVQICKLYGPNEG